MSKVEVKLVRVYATDLNVLKDYVEELYKANDDYDSMVYIEEGLKSLFRNENLATPFFVRWGEERVGYVILTRYHSVEKGGLMMYIDELFVEERHRRRGIGKGIFQEILRIAQAEGAHALWAQAEPYNDAAERFFLSQGFRIHPYKNFERDL